MIKVENLEYAYSKTDQALKGISFSIKKGEWVSILGHNGSGKSTLAKLLIGLLEPSNGSITIDGLLLNTENLNAIRDKVGIVFQNPDNQFVGGTVRYDIAFGLENRMVPPEKMEKLVLEYATKVNMQNYLEKEPHSLSGGQKQRVAIAGILAIESDVIILDESTSMLDPEGTKEVIELIKVLHRDYNKTIITITHDLNVANNSDRLIVLKDGLIILDGTPEECFKNQETLESSNVDLPFNLKLYNKVKNNTKLNQNRKLVDALWELNFKM